MEINIYETLLAQTRATKALVQGRAYQRLNVHYEVGESINRLIDASMQFVPFSMKRQYAELLVPLEINKVKPYTVDSEAALLKCEQILSILAPGAGNIEDSSKSGSDIGRIVPIGKRVFVIHGHDLPNTLRLKAMLKERFSLAPIVLSEQPSRGRSIVEKFELEAGLAAFAFALMSPDDLVSNEQSQYPQARPNVLFELGWFYGRLGRNRVCILLNERTRLPSDLDGIGRVYFHDSVDEKLGEIEAELRAASLIPQ